MILIPFQGKTGLLNPLLMDISMSRTVLSQLIFGHSIICKILRYLTTNPNPEMP